MSSFNVVIATTGRPTLKRMVDSFANDLSQDDILTIICDGCRLKRNVIDGLKCRLVVIHNKHRLGHYGHPARTYFQHTLLGDYIMNADDDDVYLPGAIKTVKKYCKEKKLYIFNMQWGDITIPSYPSIEMGNIGTPCGVYPNMPNLPKWENVREGDFHFYNELSKMLEPVWINETIYKVRP